MKYLSLICYMARVDGELDAIEEAHLKTLIQLFEIKPKYEAQIFAKYEYSTEEIEQAFTELKEKGVAYSFLLDLIIMAMADGILMEEERLMLSHIINLLDMPAADYHNLINFAQSTSSLNLETMNDPMFSYVIDSFFLWGRQAQVKLFKQTSFAIDPKIDHYLKTEL
ncbi:MAG: TerB family tellurite resistance protein [SAR324 cluster bacterium]|nr:TerB family tellurite resistance protein [SAR324 cluster bacterium]